MVSNGKSKRGPKTKQDIVNEIILIKKKDKENKLTAADIRKELLKSHKESFVPKDRAIYNIIKKNKDKITYNPLDDTWTIGSCIVNDISAADIPLLVEINTHHLAISQDLTIRQAKWISKLRPIVVDLLKNPNLKKSYPKPLQQIGLLDEIAIQYAKSEQIAEINNKPFPDTSDLDKAYFIEGPNSNRLSAAVIQNWFELFVPEAYAKAKNELLNYGPLSKAGWEIVLLKDLSDGQLGLLNEWMHLLHEAQVDFSKQEDVKEFLVQHPDIEPLTREWTKFWASPDADKEIQNRIEALKQYQSNLKGEVK